VYFLKHKSDVFEVFKKWLAQVENESGRKLKCLKSDNGGEYCDGRFKEFCTSQGIRRSEYDSQKPSSKWSGGVHEQNYSGACTEHVDTS